MNLRWKFWRRSGDKRPAAPAAQAAQPPAGGWAPLASAGELLGLQRIVGNQAVLELLAVRKAEGRLGFRPEPADQALASPFDEKARRD